MTFDETRRRRLAVDAVHDVVNAMRAIAAGRIQGAQRALRGARRYQDVLLRAVAGLPPAATTPAADPAAPRTTLLVFTSEQPLCGPFNQGVLALAERRRRESAADRRVTLVLVGRRGLKAWAAHGAAPPDVVEPAATSIIGLRNVVKRLAMNCAERHARGELGTLRVIYNRYVSLTQQAPTEETIFPPDPQRLTAATLHQTRRFDHYLPVDELRARLVAEYVFIDLYRLAAESFAGEQASRLTAMDGATRNTERMQAALRELEQRERQEEVTREILELISARLSRR